MNRQCLGNKETKPIMRTDNTRSHTGNSRSDFIAKLDLTLTRHYRDSIEYRFPFGMKHRLEILLFPPIVQLHHVTPSPAQSLAR
jgi:hypothetical protein